MREKPSTRLQPAPLAPSPDGHAPLRASHSQQQPSPGSPSSPQPLVTASRPSAVRSLTCPLTPCLLLVRDDDGQLRTRFCPDCFAGRLCWDGQAAFTYTLLPTQRSDDWPVQ
jgi:hypothetical protein